MKLRCLYPIAVLLTALALCGCGNLIRGARLLPSESSTSLTPSKAESLYGVFARKNSRLDGFKGIGRVTVRNRGISQSFRTVWTGYGTKRFRIEILGISGQPVLSFADDGKWMTWRSLHPPRFAKKPSSESSLERLIDLPVRIPDIIALIAGRAPVREYRSASIISRSSGTGPYPQSSAKDGEKESALVLKRLWGRLAERILFADAEKELRQIEIFDGFGRLSYRAVFEKMQTLSGYRVPRRILMTNDTDVTLTLEIRRYWVDVQPRPSLFVLTPPEEKREASN